MKNTNHGTKLIALFVFLSIMAASPVVFGQYGDSPQERQDSRNREYFEDARITQEIKTDILEDNTFGAPLVSIETMQGAVQLSGSVDSRQNASKAVEIAKRVNGVISVKDDLVVR